MRVSQIFSTGGGGCGGCGGGCGGGYDHHDYYRSSYHYRDYGRDYGRGDRRHRDHEEFLEVAGIGIL